MSLSPCHVLYGVPVTMPLSPSLYRTVTLLLLRGCCCHLFTLMGCLCYPATVTQSLSWRMNLSYSHRRPVTVTESLLWCRHRTITMESVFVKVPLFPVTVLSVTVIMPLSLCHCHRVSIATSQSPCSVSRDVSVTPNCHPVYIAMSQWCHCHYLTITESL